MDVRWFKTIGAVLVIAGSAQTAMAQAQTVTPNKAIETRFPWKAGELPGQFWLVRSSSPCRAVQTNVGTWQSRPVQRLARAQGNNFLCSYTWSNRGTKPDLKRLQTTSGVAQVELDPPIVTPNSDPERDSKWYGPLYALTRSRLSIPDSRGPHVDGTAVRVAVLDTAADTAGG